MARLDWSGTLAAFGDLLGRRLRVQVRSGSGIANDMAVFEGGCQVAVEIGRETFKAVAGIAGPELVFVPLTPAPHPDDPDQLKYGGLTLSEALFKSAEWRDP